MSSPTSVVPNNALVDVIWLESRVGARPLCDLVSRLREHGVEECEQLPLRRSLAGVTNDVSPQVVGVSACLLSRVRDLLSLHNRGSSSGMTTNPSNTSRYA